MISTTGRSAERGFTLLELVLVMLLLTMVAALAAPSLRNFMIGRSSADAVGQVVALAHYARTQAVSTGVVHRLYVDTNSQTYWLGVQRGAEFTDLTSEFGRRFKLPGSAAARWQSDQPGEECISFFPDGRTEASTLEILDVQGQLFEIGCRSETEPLAVLQRDRR